MFQTFHTANLMQHTKRQTILLLDATLKNTPTSFQHYQTSVVEYSHETFVKMLNENLFCVSSVHDHVRQDSTLQRGLRLCIVDDANRKLAEINEFNKFSNCQREWHDMYLCLPFAQISNNYEITYRQHHKCSNYDYETRFVDLLAMIPSESNKQSHHVTFIPASIHPLPQRTGFPTNHLETYSKQTHITIKYRDTNKTAKLPLFCTIKHPITKQSFEVPSVIVKHPAYNSIPYLRVVAAVEPEHKPIVRFNQLPFKILNSESNTNNNTDNNTGRIDFVKFENYSPIEGKRFVFQDGIFEQIIMALELNTTETLEKIDQVRKLAKSNGCNLSSVPNQQIGIKLIIYDDDIRNTLKYLWNDAFCYLATVSDDICYHSEYHCCKIHDINFNLMILSHNINTNWNNNNNRNTSVLSRAKKILAILIQVGVFSQNGIAGILFDNNNCYISNYQVAQFLSAIAFYFAKAVFKYNESTNWQNNIMTRICLYSLSYAVFCIRHSDKFSKPKESIIGENHKEFYEQVHLQTSQFVQLCELHAMIGIWYLRNDTCINQHANAKNIMDNETRYFITRAHLELSTPSLSLLTNKSSKLGVVIPNYIQRKILQTIWVQYATLLHYFDKRFAYSCAVLHEMIAEFACDMDPCLLVTTIKLIQLNLQRCPIRFNYKTLELSAPMKLWFPSQIQKALKKVPTMGKQSMKELIETSHIDLVMDVIKNYQQLCNRYLNKWKRNKKLQNSQTIPNFIGRDMHRYIELVLDNWNMFPKYFQQNIKIFVRHCSLADAFETTYYMFRLYIMLWFQIDPASPKGYDCLLNHHCSELSVPLPVSKFYSGSCTEIESYSAALAVNIAIDLHMDNEKNITVKEMNYLSNYGYYQMACNQMKQTKYKLIGIPMLIGWLLRIPDHGYKHVFEVFNQYDSNSNCLQSFVRNVRTTLLLFAQKMNKREIIGGLFWKQLSMICIGFVSLFFINMNKFRNNTGVFEVRKLKIYLKRFVIKHIEENLKPPVILKHRVTAMGYLSLMICYFVIGDRKSFLITLQKYNRLKSNGDLKNLLINISLLKENVCSQHLDSQTRAELLAKTINNLQVTSKCNEVVKEKSMMVVYSLLDAQMNNQVEFIRWKNMTLGRKTLCCVCQKTCNQISLKKCSCCKSVYYCTKKCQKKHWNSIHRLLRNY